MLKTKKKTQKKMLEKKDRRKKQIENYNKLFFVFTHLGCESSCHN